MTHKPQGEWFYDSNGDGDTAPAADDLLDHCDPHEIIDVRGAREVWQGYGFKFTNADDEFEHAWFATMEEAKSALAEIERKQVDEE